MSGSHDEPGIPVFGYYEECQLLRISLIVEDLDSLQPARLRRTVQLAQIANRFLTRAIRRLRFCAL
jgi:hypothetical protein